MPSWCCLYRFQQSSKCSKNSLHCEKLSFWFIRTVPLESLLEFVVLTHFQRKTWMSNQNTVCLSMNSWNPNDNHTFPKVFLDFFFAWSALFAPRNAEIANRKASFLARIGFVVPKFEQGILFSLPYAILRRFCPHLSTFDEIIAVLNNSHSISNSSEASKVSKLPYVVQTI